MTTLRTTVRKVALRERAAPSTVFRIVHESPHVQGATLPINISDVTGLADALENAGGGSFSHQLTIPASETVDPDTGVKVTLGFPDAGYVAVNLYDLGVIGPPDEIIVGVFSVTYGVKLTDWKPLNGISGVFYGSADIGETITITLVGNWNGT